MKKGKREEPFLKSRRLMILIVIFLSILILTFFFGDSGIIEIVKSKNRISVLKKDIEVLEKQKAILKSDIEELERNPLALEKRAREKLWLMKKNERVIIVVGKKKGKDAEKRKRKEK